MHSINRLSWVPSAAYLYTLWLDRALLAWGYLRRNPYYRREFCSETALRQQRSPVCWGLKEWEDPDQDSRAVDPLWQLPAATEVLLPAHPRNTMPPPVKYFTPLARTRTHRKPKRGKDS
jgi:hypothetical protein